MEFTCDIKTCRKCIVLASGKRLKNQDKPYVNFEVEKKWKPENGIKVLFVAESPPWNGKERYFYNEIEDKRANLRKEVLRRLDLETLKEFKKEGYFLIDAIKCRLDKRAKKNVPKEVLKSCSDRFLMKEVTSLKPLIVFVLGNSAKQALQQHPLFEELRHHKVTEDFDKILSGYRVILSVYPGGKTRAHEFKIKKDFSRLSKFCQVRF
jgi:uracil-DNA glycosylase